MNKINDNLYTFEGQQDIVSPQLVYYPAIIRENIRKMIDIAGGAARLWPHIKTHKMAEVVQMQIEAGIDRFVSNYNGDAINAVRMKKGVGVPDLDAVLSGFENNSTEDPSASAYIEVKAPEGSGGFSMLVLSSPDADRYSVRAIGALLDSEKPGMVVFCGDLSAGAEDRASLVGLTR